MILKWVRLSEIGEAIYQPRQQKDRDIDKLMKSIINFGLLTNITLREEKKGYKIIYGSRRTAALRLMLKAGIKEIPEGNAKVVAGDIEVKALLDDKMNDVDVAFNSYVENLEREDLTPMDKGLFYVDMVNNFQLTEAKIAKRLGISEDTVLNQIKYLTSIPDEILTAWKDNKVSSEHVSLIVSLETKDKKLKLLKSVIDERLSVIETEMRVLRMRDENNIPTKERAYYYIEKKFYENEEFSKYVSDGRIRLSGSHKGKWIAFNLHSPKDFKPMLKLVLDLLPDSLLKKLSNQ